MILIKQYNFSRVHAVVLVTQLRFWVHSFDFSMFTISCVFNCTYQHNSCVFPKHSSLVIVTLSIYTLTLIDPIVSQLGLWNWGVPSPARIGHQKQCEHFYYLIIFHYLSYFYTKCFIKLFSVEICKNYTVCVNTFKT